MAVKVTLTDNSAQVLAKLNANKSAALQAMGVKAVGLTVDQMEKGYGRPIRQTGDLMRSIAYAAENSGPDTVDVGSELEYAPFVHEGTSRMQGRPYLRDALTKGANMLKKVCAAYLKQGMG